MADGYIDQSAFLSDNFDVNGYANAVLAGQSYRPDDPVDAETAAKPDSLTGRGDIGSELAKLNQGIEDVTKQLRAEIASSYPFFLSHLTTSLALSDHLAPIRTSLTSLSSSMDRLHTKIHVPYEHLSTLVRRQQLLAQASDLSRRAARFVLVARRMEGQMTRMTAAPAVKEGDGEKERELAKAALSVAELDALLHPASADEEDKDEQARLPLDQLEFVKLYAPKVDTARDAIIQEMESMVINGLSDLNQPLLSSSLQTAHNLRLLPDLVSNLLADLNDAVTLRITRALDSAAIGREVNGKDGGATKYTARNRNATEPTTATTPQWVAILWNRLERVMEDIASCCIKVYTLEKVLKLKRDATSGLDFLEEVMKTQDEKPSFTFWTTLAKAFETQSKEAARSSSWLQQALSIGYPRLLRLFHDFFSKIAVHTDTVYTRDHQSTEAVLVLRSVATFENLYLSRSTSRMNEAVQSAFASRGQTPGAGEGVTIARTITNELDSARFDPLLVRTVGRNAVRVLEGMISRVDALLVKDFTATSLIGPNATPAQVTNGALVGFLYHCQYNLLFVETEFPAKVWEIMQKTIIALKVTYSKVTTPLDAALRREFGNIINRIHRVDFSKPVDPMTMAMDNGNSGSAYMVDFLDKVAFVKGEVLGRMSMGDVMREWVLELSRYLIRTFLLHASIARPMGESGKLKLTGDMTELEMGLSSLLSTGQIQGARGGTRVSDIGEAYLALRAFRQILFSPPSALSDPLLTLHLPPLIVMHHIIVLSPLRLPHEVQGWSEMEYFTWVQKHEEEAEQWGMVWKAVEGQVSVEAEGDTPTSGGTEAEEREVGGMDGEQLEADVHSKDTSKKVDKIQTREKEPESEEEWVGLLRTVFKYAEEHKTHV